MVTKVLETSPSAEPHIQGQMVCTVIGHTMSPTLVKGKVLLMAIVRSSAFSWKQPEEMHGTNVFKDKTCSTRKPAYNLFCLHYYETYQLYPETYINSGQNLYQQRWQ